MKKPRKNWLEWVIFAVSLLLVLGMAGVLVWESFSLGKKEADPEMELGPSAAHGDYFAVPATVVNRGDGTAASVQLEVLLKLPGRETEKGEFQLQYLPRHATRHAWVTFRHDPREGKLEPRVLGYQKP
ncbi:MAG TPA: hypothetical protein VGI85_05470 [Chthoniobacterales bacterium]